MVAVAITSAACAHYIVWEKVRIVMKKIMYDAVLQAHVSEIMMRLHLTCNDLQVSTFESEGEEYSDYYGAIVRVNDAFGTIVVINNFGNYTTPKWLDKKIVTFLSLLAPYVWRPTVYVVLEHDDSYAAATPVAAFYSSEAAEYEQNRLSTSVNKRPDVSYLIAETPLR